MTDRIAVAVLGFWHVHAGDYTQSIVNHPGTDLVAIWDDDEERGRAAAAQFNTTYTADLDELLARTDIDAVTVTSATTSHHDVMLRAAQAGKHIFTEKLLAPTVAEAEDILAAAESTGARVVVSLPRLYSGYTAAIRELATSGQLGELTYCRVRLAHDGATAGWLPDRFFNPAEAVGGALTDLGCHPVYLVQLFLGASPATIEATYTHLTHAKVDDNATVTLGYSNGAIGVAEASFVTSHVQDSVEVYGTKGSAIYGFGGATLLARTAALGDEWTEIAIPEDGQNAFGQWVQHIQNGTRADQNLQAAVELTRVVAAANAVATVPHA